MQPLLKEGKQGEEEDKDKAVIPVTILSSRKQPSGGSTLSSALELDSPVFIGTAQAIYEVLEDRLFLSLWETDLSAKGRGADCSSIASGNPLYVGLALGHFMFGDSNNWKKLSRYFLQATGAVADGTQPFETLQSMIVALLMGNVTMEIQGSWSRSREACILYPWGAKYIKRCLGIPAKFLDLRGKECIATLISRGKWTHTFFCPHTSATVATCFSYDPQIAIIYKHWRPVYLALFLHYVLQEMAVLQKEHDHATDFEVLVRSMCKNALSPSERSAPFSTIRQTYSVNEPQPKYTRIKRTKPPSYRPVELEKGHAGLLLQCYIYAKEAKSDAEIVERMGRILISKLYPPAMRELAAAMVADHCVEL